MLTKKYSPLLEALITHKKVFTNLSTPILVENILKHQEGILSSSGALSVNTGKYTGRSPQDRFIVCDQVANNHIDWGDINQPFSEEMFDQLYEKVIQYLHQKEAIYIFKGFAGADENYRLPIQVISEFAWQSLFSSQMFIKPTTDELNSHQASFSVISAPHFKADPNIDGTNSDAFVIISLKKQIVLIGGTSYAGEIKKAIFSIMNFLLPQHHVLPMHCSINVGDKNDVAIFFGLSGTGKTTLSTQSDRKLLGDDEHGWSPDGVFNIEGGCYAKCSYLSYEKEPEIYHAIRFGAVLENVVLDNHSRKPKYEDLSVTENTRVAYPLEYISNTHVPSLAGHPKTIIFLTADASGTLPPISQLTRDQAIYHFLSGYTSKLAGTERGIKNPEATFSACYGSPFLPLSPVIYAEMLGNKMDEVQVNVFLINTGWSGGPYGKGKRINLSHTRSMVHAALNEELALTEMKVDPIFGLNIPSAVKNVPNDLLIPRSTWKDRQAYDQKAQELALKFHQNFQQFTNVSESIKQAGPLFKND